MAAQMKNNNKEITATSDKVTPKMQRKLGRLSSSDDKCYIYQVPEFIRKGKEECYRPSVVSIGPIFYGHPQLEMMQEVKWIFLESFLQHPKNECPRLDDYIKTVRRLNKDICDCYQERKKLWHDDEFAEMIVLDAVFLLTSIIKSIVDEPKTKLSPFKINSSHIPRKASRLMDHVDRDLLVEENQLPFFVLKEIFCMACPTEEPGLLIDFTFQSINRVDRFKNKELTHKIDGNIPHFQHLLDLWWKCCYLSFDGQLSEQKHVAIGQDDNAANIEAQTTDLPRTAKQLYAGGVKFKVNYNSLNSFDIKFDYRIGELQIPKLELYNFTETYFRSLLFFEECHCPPYTCIIDFLIFFDALIDTEEDIKVLQRHGILSQLNGSEQQAADLLNDIGKSMGCRPKFFNYSDVSRNLNAYASTRLNGWMATLMREYLKHPWAILSIIFATMIFILTLLQTINSFTKN